MIKREHIEFFEKPLKHKKKVIGKKLYARLEIVEVSEIQNHELRTGLEEYHRDRLIKSIWDKLYAELAGDITDLGLHAIRSAWAPQDAMKSRVMVDALVAKTGTLLKKP